MYLYIYRISSCIFLTISLFHQELEAIEENWQSEVKELLSVVNKLQDENKRLRENARNEKYAVVAEFAAKRQGNFQIIIFLLFFMHIFYLCLLDCHIWHSSYGRC